MAISQVEHRSCSDDVIAARDGDRAAFARLMENHVRLVRTVVRDQVHSPDDVADCVQETFAKALRSVETLRDPERFRPWLTSIARRVAIDHRRRRVRDLAVLSYLVDPNDEVRCGRPSPESVVARQHLGDTVRARVRDLPPREAAAVVMANYHDRTPPEIADELGVSIGNAKVIVHRARRRLRGAIVEQVHATDQLTCPGLDRTDHALVKEHLDTCSECHRQAHRQLHTAD